MELSFELPPAPPPPPPPPPPKGYAEHWTQVGVCIKQLRTARQLTQDQLAKLVGVERTSITNIERGKQRLPLDLLDNIAKALGMRLTMRFEPLDAAGVDTCDRVARVKRLRDEASTAMCNTERYAQIMRELDELEPESSASNVGVQNTDGGQRG